MGSRHDWVVAAVAFIASLVVNGMMLAYSYGAMESRVAALEKERAEQRQEWKEARERIEKALGK